MVLIPEADVGLFVSYNSEDGSRARSEIVTAFLNRYLTDDSVPAQVDPAGAEERAEQVAGEYATTLRSHTTLFKASMLGMPASVTAEEDGTLYVTGLGEEPSRWVAIEPYVYRELYGHERIVFPTDGDGEVTRFFQANLPIMAFERLAFYETQAFNLPLLGATLFIFLITIIAWTSSLVRRKGQRGLPMVARLAAGSAALLFLAFVVLTGIGLGDDPFELTYGVPELVRTALTVAMVGTGVTGAALLFLIPVWRSEYWTLWSRLYYSLVVIALLAFVWFLYFWNLLGHQY